jgi:hypothetical protein
MNPRKVLRFPVFAACSGLLTLTAAAQVNVFLDLWTDKTVRQGPKNSVIFREGDFGIQFTDGNFIYGCGPASLYFGPSLECPLGATGYVSTGAEAGSWGSPDLDTYWEVIGIQAAALVEPFSAENISLIAAPYSTLSRPQTPFEDASFSMFYNIGGEDVRDYRICNYAFQFDYGLVDELSGNVVPSSSEEVRMDAQIVPGIYQFSFPKLENPSVPVGLSPRYYSIPEGYRTTRNQKVGVKFDYPNVFDSDGFALMNSADLKNPVKWQGITSKNVYAGFDKLYFSVKKFVDAPVGPDDEHVIDPRTDANYEASRDSLFPGFTAPSVSRILLKNPYVNNFLLPPTVPTLAAGNRGVLELELVRTATSTGVIYDRSTRRYQMPVYFGDHYEAFRQKAFKSGALLTAPTDDFDADGYINAAEWILASSPTSVKAIPKAPTAKSNKSGGTSGSYFGFTIKKNRQAVPAVAYALERSISGGPYAAIPADDPKWLVIDNVGELRVESKLKDSKGNQIDPDKTKTDKFRYVVTVVVP